MDREILELSVNDLTPHVLHEHIYGDMGIENPDDEFVEFVNEIRHNGIKQPLVVDTHGVVVSGSRRLAAAKIAKMDKVPCEVIEYTNEADVIEDLIVYNKYRTKNQLQKVREGLAYQAMLQEVLAAGNKDKLKDDQILRKIASADGKIVTRNAAGAVVSLSPRTLQTGKKVVETIDELKATGRKEEAEAIEKKAETSISGAAALAAKAQPKVEKPKDPQDILYWYKNPLWRVSSGMRSQVAGLKAKINSQTPAAFSYFMENILAMADRIDTWQPSKMTDCPVCKGTMSVNGYPCSVCIQGKTGLYKVPADVAKEEDKPMSDYCGYCGEEVNASDQEADYIQGTRICGGCRIKLRQEEEAKKSAKPEEYHPSELKVSIPCSKCGDKIGWMDKDGIDHVDLQHATLSSEGDWYCMSCYDKL